MGASVAQIERRYTLFDVPIPGGVTGLAAEPVDLRGYTIVAIVVPSTWTAANITFQASEKINGTYRNVYNDKGDELVITVAADRYVVLGANDVTDGRRDEQVLGLQYVKLRSGTSGVPVDQTTTKTLILVCTTK